MIPLNYFAEAQCSAQPSPHGGGRIRHVEARRMSKKWVDKDIASHPYLTDSVVEYLARKGDIAPEQVQKWMANTLARSKNDKKASCAINPTKIYKMLLEEEKNKNPEVANEHKKPRLSLPTRAVEVLKKFYDDHETRPYPTDAQKEKLAKEAEITVIQVSCWFGNARSKRCSNKGKKRVPESQSKSVVDDAMLRVLRNLMYSDSDPEKVHVSYCDTDKVNVSCCDPENDNVSSCDSEKVNVSYCDPEKVNVSSCDPEKVNVSCCDSENDIVSSCDPEKVNVSCCDPENDKVSSCDPEKVNVSCCDPEKVNVSCCDPEKVNVSYCDPEKVNVSSCDPEKVNVSCCDPEKVNVSCCDSENDIVSSCDPEKVNVSCCDPENDNVSSCDSEKVNVPDNCRG